MIRLFGLSFWLIWSVLVRVWVDLIVGMIFLVWLSRCSVCIVLLLVVGMYWVCLMLVSYECLGLILG